ncbi:glycosyltransferase [Flavobacterium saliperosum]|uniref:Glycosyltransferase involved in cell wall bisynthesis n=1 Tax=Flavobacterium saliperosum TaxID=329186 RepID=A0A1G4VNX9_9FLAO|nr:glycosyltransferase [Flavobacterium saliperosum]SCX09644.1 Glycosyltransferase involved in cell wall bisynthesis [Flavobacterium saliperosum]
MIRVLNILDTVGSGGVERRRLSMAKLLDKSRFELKIICTNTKGGIADEIRALGVEVIVIGDLNSPFDYKQFQKVNRIITEFKPHIIHGAVFEGVTMAAICGFVMRVPVVIIEETSDPQNRSWKGNMLMKFFGMLSDKAIGVSPAATEYLIHTLKIKAEKVQLILNGIAAPRKVSTEEITFLKESLGIGVSNIVIGSIGRMRDDNHKRFSDLIAAFALLVQKKLPVKLVLVGDGQERERYEKQVADLQLNDYVIFAGYQSDVALYYSIFNIFSLVSAYEAFGLVLAEAMLSKLPVVATKVGGMQYIVDDNVTGYLVEKFDIDAIAMKLEVLYENEQLRNEMGIAGYEKAIRNYTEERYVQKVEEIYFELIKKNKINNV